MSCPSISCHFMSFHSSFQSFRLQDFAPSELNGYPRSDGWWCLHLESQAWVSHDFDTLADVYLRVLSFSLCCALFEWIWMVLTVEALEFVPNDGASQWHKAQSWLDLSPSPRPPVATGGSEAWNSLNFNEITWNFNGYLDILYEI